MLVAGCNQSGCLGLQESESREYFTPVSTSYFGFEPLIKVTCGYYFTFVLTVGGKMFATGQNVERQLGVKSNENFVREFSPVFFPFEGTIIDITCGIYHTLVLTGQFS